MLQKNRPIDAIQIEMLTMVHESLRSHGFEQYEISNFSKPGFHSRHNLNAWLGHGYWGLGMSAHSYLKHGDWGVRFWNPPTVLAYQKQLNESVSLPFENLPKNQVEILQKHEALTDYNHTHLRLKKGIVWTDLKNVFGEQVLKLVKSSLEQEKLQNLVDVTTSGAKLNERGIQLSNLVFSEVTFLKEDLP